MKKAQIPEIPIEEMPNIANNSFFIGFEVETCFHGSSDELNVRRAIGRGVQMGTDGSISPRPGDWSAELRTQPLIGLKAFKRLEKVFNAVSEYGYTNQSTGLHVNLSPVSDELYYEINPFYLVCHPLFKEIKKRFKRENNNYCQAYHPPRKPSQNNIALSLFRKCVNANSVHHPSITGRYHGHYSAVNFDNMALPRTKCSRIEIRAFGNTNYHKRLQEVAFWTNQIIGLIIESATAHKLPNSVIL